VGSEPKSQRLVDLAPPPRWLHISGHGRYHAGAPLESELCLGEQDVLSARRIMRDLSLPVELVTLSACTSGLTEIIPGDELLGLPRAFLHAGAPTVVCTPWEARDLVALLVMERFYQGLLAGLPAALALRDAQVALREMTGRELAATFERWRRDYARELEGIALPEIPPEALDSGLFADPAHWALFMLIGRAD
jgi:CHAT domain-containing protein